MGEVWPAAQAEVAAELGTGRPDAIVFSSNTHDFLIRLVDRRAAPGRGPLARADQRRRIPQRATPARALGRGRLDRASIASPPSRSTASPSASSPPRDRRARLHPGQPGDVRQRPDVRRASTNWPRSADRKGRGSSSTAITPSWRSTGRSARQRRRPLSTSAAATNMRWRARAAPSCTRRPGFGPRPPVTGWFAEFEDLEPAARQRRLCQGRNAASSARHSIPPRCTASPPFGACLRTMA